MTEPEPLLRTLSPLLHTLERDARGWLDGPHRQPLSMIGRATLEGLATDLRRQSDALDVDRPLLIVMLMGGTGVGKSTLLNALAGASVAQASFTRPTTRDPVVYYHESVKPDRLDPALQHCRLAAHDRSGLAQKIIVDTPDLDSNDIPNREKLKALLPVADVVLYVGSQEKYHDQLGWELFKEQRKRRAFAFVLNKWDRCLHPGATGRRPDEDLLRDLTEEGFQNPLLFRTMAQSWLDAGNGKPADLPEGEQFAQLRDWLELGLTRLEIEALKARGVGQLLGQLEAALEQAKPTDLTAEAERTRTAWDGLLTAEAEACGDVLVGTLEPYAAEIEHHFRVEGQQKFRGLMAGYLKLTTKLRYAGTSLRDRIPFIPSVQQKVDTPQNWSLAAFAHECTRVAGEKVLNQRAGALVNRLLVEADRQKFPPGLLNGPANEAARADWQVRYDRALIDALAEVERSLARPRGLRRVLHGTTVFLANFLPETVFVVSFLLLLYRNLVLHDQHFSFIDLLIPFGLTLITLILMQLFTSVALPMRWSAVKGEFRKQLVTRLDAELTAVYSAIPGETADALLQEKARVEELIAEVREVRTWLDARQSAANVSELYGN